MTGLARDRLLPALATGLLLVAVTAQAYLVLADYAIPTGRRVWETRREDAVTRSARFAFGDDFAAYVSWLRDTIPSHSRVAIPKEEQGGPFGNLGLMQYFLFPRQIVDCPVEEVEACVARMTGPSSYVLAPNDLFPPRDIAHAIRQFHVFDGIRGVFGPPGTVR